MVSRDCVVVPKPSIEFDDETEVLILDVAEATSTDGRRGLPQRRGKAMRAFYFREVSMLEHRARARVDIKQHLVQQSSPPDPAASVERVQETAGRGYPHLHRISQRRNRHRRGRGSRSNVEDCVVSPNAGRMRIADDNVVEVGPVVDDNTWPARDTPPGIDTDMDGPIRLPDNPGDRTQRRSVAESCRRRVQHGTPRTLDPRHRTCVRHVDALIHGDPRSTPQLSSQVRGA